MVKIRKFKPEDAYAYYELCNDNRNTSVSYYVPGLIEDTLELCEVKVKQYSNANFEDDFAFAICNDNTIVGIIYALREYYCNSVTVYYFIGNQYQSHGFMTTALEQFIDYCKKRTNYWSLLFEIEPQNIGSQTLVKKLGAKQIGTSYCLKQFINFELNIR